MNRDDQNNAGVTTSKIKFCDLHCEHAEFPTQEHLDGAHSCRTFTALYCRYLDRLVTKNAPCAAQFGHKRPKSNM